LTSKPKGITFNQITFEEGSMKISAFISYRRYDDFFIVLDHRSGREYKLNSVGGTIIENIDQGKDSGIDCNSQFIQTLRNAGIVKGDQNKNSTPDKNIDRNKSDTVFDELVVYASQKSVPISAILELTYRCPLNCSHCYVDRSEVDEARELHKETYFKFIDDFRKLGGIYVVLTGGDPLLHKDFEPIFNYLRSKRIAVSIMSSGFSSDYALLKRVAARGVSTFQVSIHGHNAEIHDSFTGVKGSFDSAMKTLRFMKKEGVAIQAAISVNTNNVNFFSQILDFLKNEQVEAVMNYEMFPKRNGDCSPAKLNISKEELLNCMKIANKEISSRLKNKGPNDPPCNSARALFSLDPAGNIFPCLEIRQKAGNIKNEKLTSIWNNSEILNEIRNIKVKDLKECLDCDDKDFCNRCHGSALKRDLSILDHSKFDCICANLAKTI